MTKRVRLRRERNDDDDNHGQDGYKPGPITDNGVAFRERDPLDLSDLEQGLLIDKHALDDCLLQQSDLFYRVSKQLTMANSRADAAKQGVADAEAAVELSLYRSKDKYTVGEIKAHVAVAPSVKAARKMAADLKFEASQLQALKESYSQRSYAMKELVSLYIANYYGDSDKRSASKMQDAQHMENRRRMREARERNRSDD